MRRDQLAHILRAACRISQDEAVLVLGSQAILGSYDEDELPPDVVMSMEADIAFLHDHDRAKADAVEGAIGELSSFHQTNAVYAEGLHVDTVILPLAWQERIHGWPLTSSDPAQPLFLEKHDLAISKLMAGREKDLSFVAQLVRANLIDPDIVSDRLSQMGPDADPRATERALSFLRGIQ